MNFSTSYAVHCDAEGCRIINVGSGPVSRQVQPCIVTIFGATGDLTNRKLLPALYDLAMQRLLPDQFAIVGYGRRPKKEDEFHKQLSEGIKEFARLGWSEETWKWLEERIFY